MTNYRAGQRVRFTFEGVLRNDQHSDDDNFQIDGEGNQYAYIETDVRTGLGNYIEVLATPLPTEPGIYIPADNREALAYTYIYTLDSNGWKQFDRQQVVTQATRQATEAHEKRGGLVKLGVVE